MSATRWSHLISLMVFDFNSFHCAVEPVLKTSQFASTFPSVYFRSLNTETSSVLLLHSSPFVSFSLSSSPLPLSSPSYHLSFLSPCPLFPFYFLLLIFVSTRFPLFLSSPARLSSIHVKSHIPVFSPLSCFLLHDSSPHLSFLFDTDFTNILICQVHSCELYLKGHGKSFSSFVRLHNRYFQTWWFVTSYESVVLFAIDEFLLVCSSGVCFTCFTSPGFAQNSCVSFYASLFAERG